MVPSPHVEHDCGSSQIRKTCRQMTNIPVFGKTSLLGGKGPPFSLKKIPIAPYFKVN